MFWDLRVLPYSHFLRSPVQDLDPQSESFHSGDELTGTGIFLE